MAKIKLGSRPKNFKRTVTVRLHEGGEGEIPVLFKYRTRKEFGQFVDGLNSAAGVVPASGSDADIMFSLEQSLTRMIDSNADYILQCVDGWDLEVEFNRDNVVQLCDELPGGAFQIINDYREAIQHGRLGN